MPQTADRQSILTIDLGGEQIKIVRLECDEALSQHFEIDVEIESAHEEIDLLPHMGKPATITIMEDGELLRHFNGILVDGQLIGEADEGAWSYSLTLRPRAYLHDQGRNSRIFQEQTVKAILESVLKECGIKAEFGKLGGGQRNRSFCVQYGESNFSFLCRLMEEEGIYYFYQHTDTDHILVLCDAPASHVDGTATPLIFNPTGESVANVDSGLRSLAGQTLYIQTWVERVSTGGESKVVYRNHDYKRPDTPLEVVAVDESVHEEDQIEIYEYPGRYLVESEGEALTAIRLESRRATRRVYLGNCQVGSVAYGTTFTLTDHPIDRLNGKYMITRAHHSVGIEQYRSGAAQGEGHMVQIEAVPADVVWRTRQVTPRPVVKGPETAIVVGPSGETIHCDKYGRIKVKFHWDRDNPLDDSASCWIRVSQTGGLGNIILPRVGHEVLVDFINGNPDWPIIVGRVFNETHMPEYDLPEHKTKQVWRSKIYGDPGDYGTAKAVSVPRIPTNEIRMEDKGGNEEFFMHAQRDMNVAIQHSESWEVGNDQVISIGHNRTETVGVDEVVTIGNNQTHSIGSNSSHTIGANRDLTVGSNQTTTIGANMTMTIGDTLSITAGKKIVLKVGGSTITIDEKSVTIKTMELTAEGSMSADLKSMKTTVSGSANLVAKGGIVNIN